MLVFNAVVLGIAHFKHRVLKTNKCVKSIKLTKMEQCSQKLLKLADLGTLFDFHKLPTDFT